MALVFSACELLPFDIPWISEAVPTATPVPGEAGQDQTPTPALTLTEETTLEPITQLTLWVPPEMDPSLDTEASRIFSSQLQQFSESHDGLVIDVRVKAASGAGGLLDSLTATNAAAPDALPDIIALTRPDLETAALKSLIFAMDGLTDIPDDTDWFSFTREMALLQGSTFGLPFAADTLVLVYRSDRIPEFPGNWNGLIESGIPLTFPAESDQAVFQLALYLAAGGNIQDNQRRPVLEVTPLADVFRVIADGVESGTFSSNLSQYQTSAQVWTAFRDGQTDLAVTWLSNYLKDRPEDATIAPLLPVNDGAVALGTGMSWAVAAADENRQPLAVELAEFLVQPEFVSEWTRAAGYLPSRPSALQGWQDQTMVAKFSQIALMTRLSPSNDLVSSLGPILREGTRQILQGLVDPAQAAQVAVENLESQ
jgi:ABC-type glycerol-3-phosphate transport system substrate-binding protein